MLCDTCVFYPPSACDGKPCCVCDTDDALFNCYQPAAEYIKRETALALVRPDAPEDEKTVVTIATAKKLVRSIVWRTPAADVAPVVRCKDCLYWERDMGFCHYHSRYYDGGASWDIFNEDDFCSYGERKEND